ncbi:hypothetical protein ACFWBG_07110 [Nocardia salmonicida]|uniref:hypothetical protein n=1 Tax=Nocardia salmonicida TaxID=53431 RepID=UPI0036702F0A
MRLDSEVDAMTRRAVDGVLYATLSDFAEAVRRLPTERDIPTACFNELRDRYLRDGWTRIYEYDGPDAGVDYVRVHLKRGRTVLRFRWDSIDEGSVSGPRRYIEEIARYVRENGDRRPS